MRAKLLAEPDRQHQAGYLAVGLGLMNDADAVDPLCTLLSGPIRWTLDIQAARTLGHLDGRGSEQLFTLLAHGQVNVYRLAAGARAIGRLRDPRWIAPLVCLLADSEQPDTRRAFAAVALGCFVDDGLPWNDAFAAGINYRAVVETQTTSANGILELL